MERGLGLRSNGKDQEWEMSQLLFADDTVLLADSEELSSLVRGTYESL